MSTTLTTSSTSTVTKYTNSSRENYQAWLRDINSLFAKHTDKLHTVVNDDKLAKSVELRLRTQYKTLGDEFNTDAKKEHLNELKSTAYYILLDTVADTTTRKTIERKYGPTTNGKEAYQFIKQTWQADVLDDRIVAKDAQRTALIIAGAKSSSLTHMTEYVEELLAINGELSGTDFEMKDPVMVTHVLTALRKHNRAYVDGFKGRYQGVADWNKNFDNVWTELRKGLESADIASDGPQMSADVLHTTIDPRDARIAELEMKLDKVVDAITSLTESSSIKVLKTTTPKDWPLCEDCGAKHPRGKDYPCIGKALATGQIDVNQAIVALGPRNSNPQRAVQNAKERYEAHQRTRSGTSGSAAQPRKTVVLMTKVVPGTTAPTRAVAEDQWTTVEVDTKADITILTDPAFFPDGVDTSRSTSLSTIHGASASSPCTAGVGRACLRTASGIDLVVREAHLYVGGAANVLATAPIHDRARPDLDQQCLRILADGTTIPFDAGYCSFRAMPISASRDTSTPAKPILYTSVDLPMRHPDAVSAMLLTGVHFGGVTGAPVAKDASRELHPEALGHLYGMRTALGSAAIRALPETTDAPAKLSSVPDLPRNDEDALRANFTQRRPPPRTTQGFHKVVCFDIKDMVTRSKHGNNRYIVNFAVYDKHGHTSRWHPYFMVTKDQFVDRLEQFLNSGDYAAYQFFTDNEAVLNSSRVRALLRQRQMRAMRNSCEYEPWQNPAERPWRTMDAAVREFSLRGGDSDEYGRSVYWPYLVQQCATIHNARHDPASAGHVRHLRVPLCLAFTKTPAPFRATKHAAQAEMCIHLGFSTSKPGYIVEILDGPRAGRIVTSSQVKFREHMFPLRGGSLDRPAEGTVFVWQDLPEEGVLTPCANDPATHDAHLGDDDDDHAEADETDADDDDDDDAYHDLNTDTDDANGDYDGTSAPQRRAGLRSAGGVGHFTEVFNALDQVRTASGFRTLFTAGAPQQPKDPKHFKDIAKIPDPAERKGWYDAHYSENDGLFGRPDVLRMIPLPADVQLRDLKPLNTLYHTKHDGRKKARTVLGAPKGTLDQSLFGRTYSPTARPTTFRLCVALTAMRNGVVGGGDVSQAYSQAPWPSDMPKIFGRMPAGYDMYYNGVPHCVEVGNLYGHPVSGRNWWNCFRKWTLADGFTQSEHDPCLFVRWDGDDWLWVLVYVDDIITFNARNSHLRASFAHRFSQTFKWTDFGTQPNEFVSVRIRQPQPGVIELDMARYIESMCAEHFPAGVHHAYTTPAVPELVKDVQAAARTRDTSHANTELATRFRRLTMQLLYVASQCRPDVALAVSLLTRVQAWPDPTLLKHAERVLIYLVGTASLPLKFACTDAQLHASWSPHVGLEGASDATFDVAHSTSGYVFTMGNASISWAVKKQHSIALSTYHAEIMAGSLAACELVSIRGLLTELGHKPTGPTTLKMDSSSAIDLAHDPVMHTASKHIARRDLFLRELVARQEVHPVLVKTTDNVADALTKPLPKALFLAHRAILLGA